jgi:hypothetical protein
MPRYFSQDDCIDIGGGLVEINNRRENNFVRDLKDIRGNDNNVFFSDMMVA